MVESYRTPTTSQDDFQKSLSSGKLPEALFLEESWIQRSWWDGGARAEQQMLKKQILILDKRCWKEEWITRDSALIVEQG